jgi:ribosomal protein L21E
MDDFSKIVSLKTGMQIGGRSYVVPVRVGNADKTIDVVEIWHFTDAFGRALAPA